MQRDFPDRDAYRRQVPRLILEHNLHGIDIDPRAVQIATLALWLRAQRAWAEMGIKVRQRPRVEQIHIVCAEPMPGEYDLLGEFVRDLRPAVLGNLLRDVWEKMKLAGEAGSLLKIEQEIRDSVRRTRETLAAMPEAIQLLISMLVCNNRTNPDTLPPHPPGPLRRSAGKGDLQAGCFGRLHPPKQPFKRLPRAHVWGRG